MSCDKNTSGSLGFGFEDLAKESMKVVPQTKVAITLVVKLSRIEQEQVKANVKEAYGGKKEVGIDRDDRTFEVGDDVRVKLNKSKLSKRSDDVVYIQR